MKTSEFIQKATNVAESLGAFAPVVLFVLRLVTRLGGQTAASYETLSLGITLEIMDARGRRAHLKREQEVRFLAEEAGVVRDLVWGDGDRLGRYRADGADMVDVRQEGLKQVVWLGLPNRPAKGERAMVRSTRTILNGFRRPSEYYEVEVERPTKLLGLTVSFPAARPPKEGYIVASPPVFATKPIRVRYDLGPRPYIQWKTANPRPFTKFRLNWTW
jgi:hypothetical protein